MNSTEKEILSALVADIKDTNVEAAAKTETVKRPRRVRRRFGALSYMSGDSGFRTPFSIRFPS